jgi:hypothetical protein
MRLTHEPITSDLIDMELIELKFIYDRSLCRTTLCYLFSNHNLQATMITGISLFSLIISPRPLQLFRSKARCSVNTKELVSSIYREKALISLFLVERLAIDISQGIH